MPVDYCPRPVNPSLPQAMDLREQIQEYDGDLLELFDKYFPSMGGILTDEEKEATVYAFLTAPQVSTVVIILFIIFDCFMKRL
jgi:hypothetical protein